MVYSKPVLLEMIIKATENMPSFYKQDFVNYCGKTNDTGEYYTEVVAQYLCDHQELFDKIPIITRIKSYYTTSHNGEYNTTNRAEEHAAMDMFRQSKNEGMIFDKIGSIIDYQTPLKNVRSDIAGKIDLLAFDHQTNIVRVLELKRAQHGRKKEETMLRCVLESYTYLKMLNKDKCKSDFGLQMNVVFKASPLLFVDGLQEREYEDVGRIHLHSLMKRLDCTPYFIEQTSERKYRVVR